MSEDTKCVHKPKFVQLGNFVFEVHTILYLEIKSIPKDPMMCTVHVKTTLQSPDVFVVYKGSSQNCVSVVARVIEKSKE